MTDQPKPKDETGEAIAGFAAMLMLGLFIWWGMGCAADPEDTAYRQSLIDAERAREVEQRQAQREACLAGSAAACDAWEQRLK